MTRVSKIFCLLLTMLLCVPASIFASNRFVRNRFNEVVIRDKLVEFDVFSPVHVVHTPVSEFGLGHYYSLRQELNMDALADQIVRKLVEQGYCVQNNGHIPTPNPQPTDPQEPTPEEPNNPGPPGDGVPTELDEAVFQIFMDKCKNCHAGENAKGGLELVRDLGDGEWGLVYQDVFSRMEIHHRTFGQNLDGAQRMPPNGPSLDTKQVEQIRAWMRQARSNK